MNESVKKEPDLLALDNQFCFACTLRRWRSPKVINLY
jgi:hypothetical protein